MKGFFSYINYLSILILLISTILIWDIPYVSSKISMILEEIVVRNRPAPSGDIYVHDPSGIVWEEGSQQWYAFGTGILQGEFLASHYSKDGYQWNRGIPVFTQMPAWVKEKVPHKTDHTFWAPDIIFLNNLWHLYYAVSTFGSQVSCIGVTTTPSLAKPTWTDFGPVICSNSSDPYNTIDPHVLVDSATNITWMNYGSYWTGIYLVQLTGNPVVGVTVGSPIHLADDVQASNGALEASWIQQGPAGDYWLFANWGQCCEGINSTYNIRVGRSTNITGPYIDDSGVYMLKGGGTMLMNTSGRQIGPGQIGFPKGGPQDGPGGNLSAPIVSYHYYDLDGNPPGNHTLGQALLTWNGNGKGWPSASDRL